MGEDTAHRELSPSHHCLVLLETPLRWEKGSCADLPGCWKHFWSKMCCLPPGCELCGATSPHATAGAMCELLLQPCFILPLTAGTPGTEETETPVCVSRLYKELGCHCTAPLWGKLLPTAHPGPAQQEWCQPWQGGLTAFF